MAESGSSGLITASLTLSLVAGSLTSYFMGRRMAKMKPAEILNLPIAYRVLSASLHEKR